MTDNWISLYVKFVENLTFPFLALDNIRVISALCACCILYFVREPRCCLHPVTSAVITTLCYICCHLYTLLHLLSSLHPVTSAVISTPCYVCCHLYTLLHLLSSLHSVTLSSTDRCGAHGAGVYLMSTYLVYPFSPYSSPHPGYIIR